MEAMDNSEFVAWVAFYELEARDRKEAEEAARNR
jgi:hypothetical protein